MKLDGIKYSSVIPKMSHSYIIPSTPNFKTYISGP